MELPGLPSGLSGLPLGIVEVPARPTTTWSHEAPTRPASPGPSVAGSLARLARPRQWVKNLLVLAAPLAAGRLGSTSVLLPALLTVVAFCAASSATYAVNDTRDRHVDRHHPRKQHRPVASGAITPTLALAWAAALALGAITTAATVGGTVLALVVVGYLALTTAYSLGLKDVPIVDVAAISAGFILRAVGGAVATDVVPSDWFLVVVSACALFVAVGKRFSELQRHGTSTGRNALTRYTAPYLRHLLFSAATVAILSYGLWAFEAQPPFRATEWLTLSIAPFALALFTYALRVEQGEAEAPEEVLLTDRGIQVLGATWGILFVLGIHA